MKGNENHQNKFLHLLLNELPAQFTGQLKVDSYGQSWTIFFCLGRLA